ncbi:MAG: D-alanine--D-serine ligase VanG [Bacilli bacterium]|nr:D-alanine--D-serine ligase VanG [Bacilli bacterium]MDY5058869.1 D-alanine--D-serine ligase VanG [Bacilli bacterium]
MSKIRVACLFGGCSSEYDVSLVSASSVIRNISQEKYEVIMIGITREGDFYLYNGNVDDIEKNNWFNDKTCKKITFSNNKSDHGFIILETNKLIRIDIAFPILHGKNGEDGRLQGLLELAEIPIVGCGMTSSAICMDKYIAHKLVESNGILVPKSYLFTKYDNKNEIKERIINLKYPIFVKPLKAGSSFGITKVLDISQLDRAIDYAFSYDDSIIIEEGIDGFEVGCAILGNNELIIGEVDEIELQDGFFDYEEKYTLKTSKIILPAELPELEREKIKNTALKIYKILGCKGFSRVDMFYTKDNKIVFNEVNTIPGCTSHSRYPSMLKQIGYNFEDVIDKWITLGLER